MTPATVRARGPASTPTTAVVPEEALSIPRAPTRMATIIEPTRAQIRERAYFIYLARNGGPGDSHSDWAQAERELREEARRTTCATRKLL